MKESVGLVDGVRLGEREVEILKLAAQGLTTREIAAKVSLSPNTVEKMLGNTDPRSLYAKIGASNRSQATAWYVGRFGLPASETDEQQKDSANQDNHWLSMEVTAPYLLEIAGDFSLRIRAFTEGGNPELAFSAAVSLSNRLKQLLRSSTFHGNAKPLYQVFARVLFEQIMASKMMVSPDKALAASWPTIKELLAIAKLCRDPEIAGLAYSCWADSYYQAKQYRRAVRCYKKALSLITDVHERVGLLRGCALANAYLSQEDEYTYVKKVVTQLIGEGHVAIDVVCHAYEGLARAEGLLYLHSAPDTLNKGRDAYKAVQTEIGRRPVRAIQLDRSEFEILVSLKASNKTALEKLGTNALARAEEYGYHRHAIKIHRLLVAHLV